MFLMSLRLVLLSLLTAFTVIACSANPSALVQETDCRSVPHAMGTTEVCGSPENIVVLGGHSLDLLLSLGEQPAGCGTAIPFHAGQVFDQPSEQIPYLGQFITTQPVNVGDRSQPSLEVIAQIQPDLIVGEAGGNRETYGLLSQIAPTLLWDIRTNRGQWQQNLRALALALGDEAEAEAVLAELQQDIAATRETLKPVVAEAPNALVLGANRLASGNIFAITSQSYLGELMEQLGFEMVAPENGKNSAPLSLEALPELDTADHVFVLGYSLGDESGSLPEDPDPLLRQQTSGIKADWRDNAIAQSLSATQNNQVYFGTYLLWNGLNGPIGTRLVLEEMEQMLTGAATGAE